MKTREQILEAARIRSRVWRKMNRKRHRAYQRSYRKEHVDECYKRNRAWALANPDKVKAAHKRSRKKNPEGYKKIALRWRAKNPDARKLFCAARRARTKSVGGKVSATEWAALKNKYGNRCICCRKRKKLTMDHVVPIIMQGPHVIANIQPLCRECNSAKGPRLIDYRPLWEETVAA